LPRAGPDALRTNRFVEHETATSHGALSLRELADVHRKNLDPACLDPPGGLRKRGGVDNPIADPQRVGGVGFARIDFDDFEVRKGSFVNPGRLDQ